MSSEIQVRRKDSVYSRDTELSAWKAGPIEGVIDTIRGIKYQDTVINIRIHAEKLLSYTKGTAEYEHYYKELKKLKNQLPLIYSNYSIIKNPNEDELDYRKIPNGLIGFDIDSKDNTECDFDCLVSELKALPETYYLFRSPSNGVKFAILTDFQLKSEDEQENWIKERCKQAYDFTLKYVENNLSQHIQFDNSVGNLHAKCFISYDPDCYYNKNANKYLVQDSTHYESVKNYTQSSTCYSNNDNALDYFNYIDPGLADFDVWAAANYAAFSAVGEDALEFLLDFWRPLNPRRFEERVRGFLKEVQSGTKTGNIGTLYNLAKQHPQFKKINPKHRTKSNATVEDIQLSLKPLVSLNEATEQLIDYYHEFLEKKESRIIKISTGVGKSHLLREKILKKLPFQTKCLVLVETHNLAEQYVESLKKLTLNEIKSCKSWVKHLFGKTGKHGKCDNKKIRNQFETHKLPIPTAVCMKCSLLDCCRYVNDLNEPGTIRIMTHSEWKNESSAFFHGIEDPTDELWVKDKNTGEKMYINEVDFDPDKHIESKKIKWIPDYIVIDECPLSVENEVIEMKGYYDSIREIINAMLGGKTLEQACVLYREDLDFDYALMNNALLKKPSFETKSEYVSSTEIADYINTLKKFKSSYPQWLDMLEKLRNFSINPDNKEELKGIRISDKKMCYSKIKISQDNYKEIPTMILDASADDRMYSRILPKYKFNELLVKKSNDIKIYQCQDRTLSRNYVGNNLNLIVNSLKYLVKQKNPKSLGLITYQNLNQDLDESINNNFDVWLGNQLNANVIGHFKGLRGLDSFAAVDLLLIVGRHYNPHEVENNSYAIFGDGGEVKKIWTDVFVRMSDGTTKTLRNDVNPNESMEASYEMTSKAEMVQAIGRGRIYHGNPKEIYIFSNEALGQEVEIDELFKFADLFLSPLEQEILEHIQSLNLDRIENKRAVLLSLKFKDNWIKTKKDSMEKAFSLAGYEEQMIPVIDKNRHKLTKSFWCRIVP